MITELYTIAKNRMLLKVNELKARRAYDEYIKTLSPEKQVKYAELRRRLDTATPAQAMGILRREAAAISEAQMRITERIERVRTNLES